MPRNGGYRDAQRKLKVRGEVDERLTIPRVAPEDRGSADRSPPGWQQLQKLHELEPLIRGDGRFVHRLGRRMGRSRAYQNDNSHRKHQ